MASEKPLMEGVTVEKNTDAVTTVTVEEGGFFRKAIPTMPRCLAWICLWLNLVPGFGTLISAFAGLSGSKTDYKEQTLKAFFVNLLSAFLQLLTAPLVIGFIWSIMWGMAFVNKAEQNR